jgi:hypothetical protein
LSETKKVVVGIIAVNAIIFIAGLTPQFRNIVFQKFVMSTHSS